MSDIYRPPWTSNLFGDTEIETILATRADIERMLRVEAAWTRALGQSGAVDSHQAEQVAQIIERTTINYRALHKASAVDGVPVPALVEQLRGAVSDAQADSTLVHSGLTSQDVIDTVLMLALSRILPILEQRLNKVLDEIQAIRLRDGHRHMMAHTRMQPALPFLTADRLDNWSRPLSALSAQSGSMIDQTTIIQWGGPIGVRDRKLPEQQAEFFATALELRDPGRPWQNNRGVLVDLAAYLSKISGALGKIGQDLALQAQSRTDELALTKGGHSSAMPHKNNPILAELLVTLARYNAGHLAQMHGSLVHEQERSGTAWMMEWLVLPQMLVSTGRSLLATQQLLSSLGRLGLADT